MTTPEDLDTSNTNTWCPGCGNFGMLLPLKQTISELGLNPDNVVVVSGIGCSGKLPHFINTYGLESIHGRPVAAATGIKLANPNLTVIAVGGDGDGYGIGLNHFLQAVRRNINIVYMVHNNQIYGLTKGQTSPTSEKGYKSKSTPHGNIELPVNPLTMALASHGTFVSRGFAGKQKHLKDLLKKGIQHKGFALVDVFQPCVTWNKINTYQFFNERVYELDANYKTNDKDVAFKKAREWGEKIPIGIFYKEDRPTYNDELPQNKDVPVAKQDISKIDIDPILESYY